MAFAPNQPIVSSGNRQVNFWPVMTAGKQMADTFQQGVDKTSELFENWKKEREELNQKKNLELGLLEEAKKGLTGRNFEEMNKLVLETRDRMANFFKGKKLADWNKPEFQAGLYEIKESLGELSNRIATDKEKIAYIEQYRDNATGAKASKINEALMAEMEKPVTERNWDALYKTISSSTEFNNPIEILATKVTDLIGKKSQYINNETKNYVTGYIQTEQTLPDDEVIYTLFKTDPVLYNHLLERIPVEDLREITDEGNNDVTEKAVITRYGKQMIEAINANGSNVITNPDLRLKNNNPTAASTKEADKLKRQQNFIKNVKADIANGTKRAWGILETGKVFRVIPEYSEDGKSVSVTVVPAIMKDGKIKEDLNKSRYRNKIFPIDETGGGLINALNWVSAISEEETDIEKDTTYIPEDKPKSLNADERLKK